MNKINQFLTKLFPNHSTGNAGFMVALILAAVIVACIATNDLLVRHYPFSEVSATYGFCVVCACGVAATYFFADKKKV